MVSYDGAESCELVGVYLLHKIKEKFGSICDFGLYRDDGLGISRASPRQTELIKKDLCGIFSSYGLKITIEANKKTVNFLDVTLNLSDGKYMAYTKPGNTPLYVNRKSNHPPRINENIPKSINKRLSEISIDETSFNQSAPLYQKALDDSGYHHIAARIVANKRKYEHVTPILRSLNWLPVRDQLYFRDAVLAFKCMSGLAPVYLSDKLITRSTVSKRESETRNSQMLSIPLFRTATGQKTFY